MACTAGTFADCLGTEETAPLDAKERSRTVKAPGIGLVVDGGRRLTVRGTTR